VCLANYNKIKTNITSVRRLLINDGSSLTDAWYRQIKTDIANMSVDSSDISDWSKSISTEKATKILRAWEGIHVQYSKVS